MPDHYPDYGDSRKPDAEDPPPPVDRMESPGYGEPPTDTSASPANFLSPDLGAGIAEPEEPPPLDGLPGGPRLTLWLGLLLVSGALSLLFRLQEAAFLVVLSGLFVAAQAADIYPSQRRLYWMLTWTVPVTGAAAFGILTWAISQMEATPTQMIFVAMSATSSLICLLMMFRPFSDAVTRTLFRDQEPSHALRLAARIVVMGLLIALPGWYAFQSLFEKWIENPGSLVDEGFLGSGLIGYVLLALAAVGFQVRRNWRDALERLGIRALRPAEYAIIPFGVLLLFGMNVGLEAIQRAWFPNLWLGDQRISQLIATGLGAGQIVMLGLSAGIGEEITLRGALQPRLGLIVTSLLFAALHIQYSWFGMGVIFLFGLVLGTIRNRTCTTVAIAVHTLYDVAAVFSIPQAT
jgi:CAAX protease family protein